MKKIIIAIVSLFSFFVFCFLGTLIIVSNTFGVNVNTDKLFPSITLTALEEDIIPANAHSYMSRYIEADNTYTIINNTGEDIKLNTTTNTTPLFEGTFEFDLFLNDEQYLTLNNNQITISSIPGDYGTYFHNGSVFHADDDMSQLNFFEREGFGDDLSQQEINNFYNTMEETTKEITIKKGSSYEIKLPK